MAVSVKAEDRQLEAIMGVRSDDGSFIALETDLEAIPDDGFN